MKDKIINFLEINGWKRDDNGDYISFYKDNNIGFDITEDEIVFIGDCGDFLHHKITKESYFWLIGYMITNGYISIDFKRVDQR